MTSAENVRVAVRVRPFSERELGRKAKLVVHMQHNTTNLTDPEHPKAPPKKFIYDYSYWSHDGYRKRDNGYLEPEDPHYTDQEKLFNDLGIVMLDNAWKGYNCSLFAYGQTGSGKSYSVVGSGPNPGLIPRTCEELFREIDRRKKASINFAVTFSMLEIYNEQVRDLLNKKKTPSRGLTVKEHPSKGFYVEGLNVVPVGNFTDIRNRMNEGNRQRTIAATKMNETSSRAHTIVTIHFTQNFIKRKTTTISHINLVDLAGSERTKQTESSGDRFEEARNINLSLLTLGSVIKALCDKVKKPKLHVPYRDAVLTKLLKNALGGNSKTVMMAAISPDAENYEQTLSTLKYADRAKSIRTEAKVNEAATDKIIRELIAEKEQLLKELEMAKSGGKAGYNEEDMLRMKSEHELEIKSLREQMEDSVKVWEKQLEISRKERQEMEEQEKQEEEEKKKLPHLSNLNEDPALTGKLVYVLREGRSHIGNGKDDSNPEIVLNGLRIAKEHALIKNDSGTIVLRQQAGSVLYNGQELTRQVQIHHGDRIRFGSNNLFSFVNPMEAERWRQSGKVIREVDYQFALNEIAKHSGIDLGVDNALLQEEMELLVQSVSDVTAMAEDMERQVEFSTVLISPEALGRGWGRTEVYIKVHDLENGNEYLWDKEKFLNRQVHMQEMFQQFEENDGLIPEIPKEKDPYWDPPTTPVLVGVSEVSLSFLSHMMEFKGETLSILDYTIKQAGFLLVDTVPCNSDGDEDVDLSVDDPMDLVNTSLRFKLKIHQAFDLPERFVRSYCKYTFYHDDTPVKTDVGSGRNPTYNHEKWYHFKKKYVDHKFIDYLREQTMAIQIWGEQGDKARMTSSVTSHRREEKRRLQDEVYHWKSKTEDLQDKLKRISDVVKRSANIPEMNHIKCIIEEDEEN